ncbi:MAG TPA: hypothetical protein VMF08_14120 [Candidatus Sulfotelmatobacter sp.]|nr:hypothetical protein [Candidatus Sulfotelmatobacter sp.]
MSQARNSAAAPLTAMQIAAMKRLAHRMKMFGLGAFGESTCMAFSRSVIPRREDGSSFILPGQIGLVPLGISLLNLAVNANGIPVAAASLRLQ